MAIDPATLKLIATTTLKIITDEEKRTRLILGIVILVVLLISIIMIPIYILTNPIETIKILVTDEKEISNVEQVKTDYEQDLKDGELTYKGKFPFPLEQADKVRVTSKYGTRTHPITGVVKRHTGIDLSGVHHDNVLVIADGEVTWAGVQKSFGNCIEVKHEVEGETFYSFYAHLSQILVIEGQQVTQGKVIAKEGGDPATDPNVGSSTGHHLHFEIRTSSRIWKRYRPYKLYYR